MPSISLPKTLDLGAVPDLAAQLLALRCEALVLDAGALHKLTGIGLEVLVSAAMQWRADGHSFAIVNWSEAAHGALDALGADPTQLFERA